MIARTTSTWRRLLVALALALFALGCQEEPMRQGKAALVAEKADLAEAQFQKVLKAEPDNVEARRLMADVYRLRGDFEKAESTLRELWDGQGFGEADKELTAEQKTTRMLMEDQFQALYSEWVAAIDASEDPDTFEKVVRRGLEMEPKSIPLNNQLVAFYEDRADRLVEQGKKLEAAEAYEKILELRATRSQRDEADERARTLRLEAFQSEAEQRFQKKVLPELAEGQWDAEKKVLLVRVEQPLDRRLRPGREADTEQARTEAAKAFAIALYKTTALVGDLPPDEFSQTALPKHTIAEEDFSRGKYTIVATVAFEDLVAAAFAETERRKAAAEAQAKAPADDAERAVEKAGDDAAEDAAEAVDEAAEGDEAP